MEADARYEINAFSPNYRPENVFKDIDEARLLSDRYVTIALRKFGLSPAAGDGELKLIRVERLRAR